MSKKSMGAAAVGVFLLERGGERWWRRRRGRSWEGKKEIMGRGVSEGGKVEVGCVSRKHKREKRKKEGPCPLTILPLTLRAGGLSTVPSGRRDAGEQGQSSQREGVRNEGWRGVRARREREGKEEGGRRMIKICMRDLGKRERGP